MRWQPLLFDIALVLCSSALPTFAANADLAPLEAQYKQALGAVKPEAAYEIARKALGFFPEHSRASHPNFPRWELRAAHAADLNGDNAAAEKLYEDACPRLARLTDRILENECLGGLGMTLLVNEKPANAQRVFQTLRQRPSAERGTMANMFLAYVSDQGKEQNLAETHSYVSAAISTFDKGEGRADGFLAHNVAELSIRFAGELIGTPQEDKGLFLIASSLALFGKVIGRLNPDMTDIMFLALQILPPNRGKKDIADWAIEVATANPNSAKATALFAMALTNLKLDDREDDVALAIWRWTNHVQKQYGPSSLESAEALSFIGEWLFDQLKATEGEAIFRRSESLAAKADGANEIRKSLLSRIQLVRESHSRSENINASIDKQGDETARKFDRITKSIIHPQPGRRDMTAEEIGSVAAEKINYAMNAIPSERFDLLKKASYDILYPPDLDIGNSMSDAETLQRLQQQKRICDLGLTLALEETPAHPAFFGFLRDEAAGIALIDGTEEAIHFVQTSIKRLKTALTFPQRLAVTSIYPSLFVQRQRGYKLSSSDAISGEDSLTTIDKMLHDVLSLQTQLLGENQKVIYNDMLFSFAKVYTENGHYASAEKILKSVTDSGSQAKMADSIQYKLAMKELKLSKDGAAEAVERFRSSLASIKREKDVVKRESLLDDAWAEVVLKRSDFDIARVEIELSRAWIGPQVADLESRAAALTMSPYTQINWRQNLIDRAVFEFLEGAVDTKLKSSAERRHLIDEAIKVVQLQANDRADSALLRSALRSFLKTPLKSAAKGVDDAYVLWRRENDELVKIVAYGDLLVGDKAIKDLEDSRDRSANFNNVLASAAPGYQRVLGLSTYTHADLSKYIKDDEAIIHYVYRKDGSFAFVITKTDCTIYDLNAYLERRVSDGSGELEEIIDKYLASIINEKNGFDLQASEQLYRRLIGPIEGEIRNKRHLIIIPEGPLLNIPFAALRKSGSLADLSSNSWLIDAYSLTTALSIKSFLALRQAGAATNVETSIVAFADPTIHDERGLCAAYSGWVRRSQKSRGICALPEARDQAFALASIAGVNPKDSVIFGSALTVESVEQKLSKRVGTVVFATHALLPAESKKLLGTDQPALLVGENNSVGEIKKSWLTADMIELLNIDANLVILSACNTGAPDQNGGNALSGLARAFFAAGARGVMATNWYVDAGKTRELLTDIVSSLKANDGLQLADAMQIAMSKRARQGLQPRDWALFSYVGR
jgi:CHAT domain-containing protein